MKHALDCPTWTGRILAIVATLQVNNYEAELSDAATAPSPMERRRPARRAFSAAM